MELSGNLGTTICVRYVVNIYNNIAKPVFTGSFSKPVFANITLSELWMKRSDIVLPFVNILLCRIPRHISQFSHQALGNLR